MRSTVAFFWRQVRGLRHVRVTVEDAEGAVLQRGAGLVRVESPEADVTVFEEEGTWEAFGVIERPMAFHNRMRWMLHEGGGVEVAHLRRGAPQVLYVLQPAQGALASAAPYHCGDDTYEATMVANDDGLRLRCRVRGPRKDYTIVFDYRYEGVIPARR